MAVTLNTPPPIVVITPPEGVPLYLSLRGPVEVGRECNGIMLSDPQVSRRHLLLETDEAGNVIVTELGSTNGSTLDGGALTGPTVLGPSSAVRCGGTSIRVETTQAEFSSAPGRRSTAPGGTIIAGGPDAPNGSDPTVVRPRAAHSDIRRTSIDAVADAVANAPVDVASLRGDQSTVTIVFSDIESSTERNVALGDQVWFDVLAAHNAVVARCVHEHGGTIIKNQGDGFMLSFPGARRALDCMVNVQRDLTMQAGANPDRGVRVRVGVHTGEVLVDDDGDLFGQHVVVAARVANLARGGEILVSSLTREIVASRGDVVFGEAREVHLKGIGDATVYPIDWARS